MFVCRLSWLGLRFMAIIWGLMKQGVAGSTLDDLAMEVTDKGGRMESPFMLRGRRGAGEVMGRLSTTGLAGGSRPVLSVTVRAPNVVFG